MVPRPSFKSTTRGEYAYGRERLAPSPFDTGDTVSKEMMREDIHRQILER